jgi:hypothetical protein
MPLTAARALGHTDRTSALAQLLFGRLPDEPYDIPQSKPQRLYETQAVPPILVAVPPDSPTPRSGLAGLLAIARLVGHPSSPARSAHPMPVGQ